MGNICSFNQKNCKDTESEISESGNNDSQEKELKPLEEAGTYNSPHDENAPKHNESEIVNAHDSNLRPPESNALKKDDSYLKSTPSIICGSPVSNDRFYRNKKIVICILTNSETEYKHQVKALCNLYPNIWAHCKAKGFELTKSLAFNEKSNESNSSISLQNTLEKHQSEIQIVHEEVATFLAEIERNCHSYIIPILFMGSSLGIPNIPIAIQVEDFSNIISTATKEQSEILQKFYILNNSSEPLKYDLIKCTSEKDANQILEILIELMPNDLKNSYLPTAFEQEITYTLMKTNEFSKRCIWVQSDSVPSISRSSVSPIIYAEMTRRLSSIFNQLKRDVSIKNTIRAFPNDDIQEELFILLENAIKSNLDSIINNHLKDFRNSQNTFGMCKQIVEEIEAVKRHSIAIGATYTNAPAIEAASRYIHSDSVHPLVFLGKSGEGKSTLAADIALEMNKWMPNSQIVLRFANLTVLSSEICSLLATIAEEVSILVTGKPNPIQHEIHQYTQTIERILENSKTFILIIIDSVDRVSGSTDINWLPRYSKSNIKIILTVTSNNDLKNNWASDELLKTGIPKENLQFLNSENTLKNDSLPTDQQSLKAKNQFHTKVISRLSWLGMSVKDSDSDEFIEKLFSKLESKVDRRFLETLLVTISISTYGIYETDCLNIFQQWTNINKIESLSIWSKFCWILGPMLLHTDKIKIMDSTFQKAILKRYSNIVLKIKELARNYFENLPDLFFDFETNQMSVNAEKFSAAPQYGLAVFAEVEKRNVYNQYFSKHYFRDLSWIFNKISSCGSFQYLNDILTAENVLKVISTDSHIKVLKQFLTLHMVQINCDAYQFHTLFKTFVQKYISKDISLANSYVEEWIMRLEDLKTIHFECLSNNKEESNANEKGAYNDVVSLKAIGYYVAAVKTDCNEISVWDVARCKQMRILKGVPQPSLLCSIKDFEAAVLCKREIRVLDLKEGVYKATLKGMMNQKMPYFGLHDMNHLVCLSRNRMYVNLMNIQSGDCVTSFKAGEDRFLNSLIVSGNGRILICGDESQKPFSLLVWHLSQRRLLYDFRIPHHDLLSSLSAITHEGSYLSVVAKEIRESAPNFIVVYDVQSGTLFQKLKPACNTVAIAISQANGCVLAGLENAEILIWDLVTGNCRYTLIGHNAPVTLLKLDPLGRCLLSGDKNGRDLSMRLWELSTGKSLAVYSSLYATTSCEILENGIFVVLAQENNTEVPILRLRNYNQTRMLSDQCFNV